MALAPAASASQNETVFFEAPTQLLSPTARPAAIAQMQSLGVHAVRILLLWSAVAPKPNSHSKPKKFSATNPADYNWGQYLPLLAEMKALKWKVLLTVTGPLPCWASACKKDQVTSPNEKDYGQFMEAVGKEFGNYVKLYSIWNEPNQPQFLEPQYSKGKVVSATTYRALFLDGYAGLKASGNFSGAKVLMGETSPIGSTYADIPPPLLFMRDVLCLNGNYVKSKSCGKLPAAGYAQHPYTQPTDPSSGVFWVPPSADDVTITTLGRLATALNRAAAAGAVNKNLPIYVTEFGIQTKPSLLGVSDALQAEYDAISEHIAWSNPRVVSFDQYLLADDPSWGFQSGLETHKGAKKTEFNGWRLPLTVTRYGSKVDFWGVVRPAPAALAAASPNLGPTTATAPTASISATSATGTTGTASTSVVIEYSANSGKTWKPLTSAKFNSGGYWTASGIYASKRVWRTEWSSPSGTVYVGAKTSAFSASGKPQK